MTSTVRMPGPLIPLARRLDELGYHINAVQAGEVSPDDGKEVAVICANMVVLAVAGITATEAIVKERDAELEFYYRLNVQICKEIGLTPEELEEHGERGDDPLEVIIERLRQAIRSQAQTIH